MILSRSFQTYLPGKMTCPHLWKCLMALLLEGYLSRHTLDVLLQRRIQRRLL